MKSNKSNTELLQLIREDNMVAFYNLYERYSKRLFGFVLKYLKQESDAEEIVQEVFIKIWENRASIDIFSSFESFLFTIAYNKTISLFRQRTTENKYLEHLKSIQQVDEEPVIIDEIYYTELKDKIQSLLDELSPRQKEIFQLSREQGLTHQEIAAKLNISVNTVKKHMVNTLAFLKLNIGNGNIVSVLFVYLFL